MRSKSNQLSIQIDPRHRALYIYLRPIRAGGVTKTEQLAEGLMADLGANGEILGVEVLGADAVEKLFDLVSTQERFSALRELSTKKDALRRMIA